MLMSNGWSLGGSRRALVATLPLARSFSPAPSSGTGEGEPALTLQLTLAITIRPHIVKDPSYSLQAIRQIALDDGFYFASAPPAGQS